MQFTIYMYVWILFKNVHKLSFFSFPLQQLEVVPLYGDMQINPYHYIKYSKNFDPAKWPACESSHPSPQSNLLANLEAIRDNHMSYISQLARHSNEVGPWRIR